MLQQGALDEARALADGNLDDTLPAMRAVGVRELLSHIRGEIALEEAARLAKTNTRRYAKRQLTWIRSNFSSWNSITQQ
jgi:tRNA dimethylallyltransferase